MNTPTNESRRLSLIALALLVPVPTIGVVIAMWLYPGPDGQAVYGIGKVWLLLLPAAWLVWVDRERIGFIKPSAKSLMVGLGLGVAIFGVLVGGYYTVGQDLVDRERLLEAVARNGLDDPARYIALAVYLTFINSLLEEYVWRWFVGRQCLQLVRRAAMPVVSGLLFTIHHIIALRLQFGWGLTILGSAGVFVGGVTWSWLWARYGQVWAGWVCHICADAGVFLIGWIMIFSQGAGG